MFNRVRNQQPLPFVQGGVAKTFSYVPQVNHWASA